MELMFNWSDFDCRDQREQNLVALIFTFQCLIHYRKKSNSDENASCGLLKVEQEQTMTSIIELLFYPPAVYMKTIVRKLMNTS